LLLAHLRVIFQHSRVAEHAELVDRLFQSQMSYGTKCLRCHHKSSRPSSYYEIVRTSRRGSVSADRWADTGCVFSWQSLNIKGHKTVERCIESYLAAELLDGDNQYFCDECNAKQNAERFIEIDAKKLPSVLTLQLMRFVFDAQAGRKKKLMVGSIRGALKCSMLGAYAL
jgi:ubiquitin C-terminal hydrolase